MYRKLKLIKEIKKLWEEELFVEFDAYDNDVLITCQSARIQILPDGTKNFIVKRNKKWQEVQYLNDEEIRYIDIIYVFLDKVNQI